MLDQLWGNLKDVPEDEFLGGIVSQLAGCMPLLSFVQCTKISFVQRTHNRVAEIRENVSEIKGEPATGKKEIVRQTIEIAGLGSQ